MSNQTPKERRAYQNTRTKFLKEAAEADRTPEIRALQRRERELQMKYTMARTQENRDRIRKQHGEVWALLCEKIKPVPREIYI